MPLAPSNLQLIGQELAIQWDDGMESYLSLDLLRRACPCAGCGGEPDVLGNISRPQVTYSARSFELRGWQLVGGYAVQPQWADGHGTGIYSYQYLRRLAGAG
ncbi:MAG: gamma-butyrobetaine hydroxylase-like domain-containing protein [Chthoniobacterales bacterium]